MSNKRCIRYDRVGEKAIALNGQEMTIIGYNNCDDITVQFEDGTTTNTKYIKFKHGEVHNKNHRYTGKYNKGFKDRTGETSMTNSGEKMTIIKYNNSSSIDIQFEDGTILYNRRYYDFKIGNISKNETKPRISRLGQTNINNENELMTIVDIVDTNDVIISFENGFRKKVRYSEFIKGRVRNNKKHIGETVYSTNGQLAKIVNTEDCNNNTIEFEDGTIVKNIVYKNFKMGQIKNPNIFICGSYNIHKYGCVNRGAHIKNINISKVVYRGEHPSEVYYLCECSKCNMISVLTPSEMLKHKCI